MLKNDGQAISFIRCPNLIPEGWFQVVGGNGAKQAGVVPYFAPLSLNAPQSLNAPHCVFSCRSHHQIIFAVRK